uniref:GIY-YIG endonuclease n=1 Tax=Ophiognomonia clavigignenti-juglandacearum TaxID=218668 RepID=A0A291LJ96_9PEZI|nr:GIY-YIG endonuclease [Ophiognomonia clavigignenti-juglandacearum]
MKNIIKYNKNRIVRFSTSGMKIGIVSASSVPVTKTQRRVSASTLEMKMGWLAGAFRYYSANNTNNKNIHNVIPVACYPNADTQKSVATPPRTIERSDGARVILKENKDKVGIYRWVNLINGKTYVGSSGNLSARFRQYFNVNTLESKLTTGNSKIYSSLLKNGYSNFRLEVLEYCELDILNFLLFFYKKKGEREQHYLPEGTP